MSDYMPVELKPNPIKKYREGAQLSQAAVAAFAGVQRLTVIRTEQGLFERIPGTVLLAVYEQAGLDAALGLTRADVEAEYSAWQLYARRYYGPSAVSSEPRRFNTPTFPTKDWAEVYKNTLSLMRLRAVAYCETAHPLQVLQYATGATAIGFCKYLCVNPGPIHRWLTWQQHHMPMQLRQAFKDAGYRQEDIDWLSDCAETEYIKHRVRRTERLELPE